jgi:hypothetical protein
MLFCGGAPCAEGPPAGFGGCGLAVGRDVVELFAAWTLERGDCEATLVSPDGVPICGGGEEVASEEPVGVWLLDFRLLPPRKLRRDMLLGEFCARETGRGRWNGLGLW